MIFGILTFILALGGAGFLLYTVAKDTRDPETGALDSQGPISRENLLKLIILLTISATLFAANLWPLAFMVLIAAGSISAIEYWKQSSIAGMDQHDKERATTISQTAMSLSEARAVLGVEEGASSVTIREAHKNLITQLHPDKGGTDYFAVKINQAREILLASLN